MGAARGIEPVLPEFDDSGATWAGLNRLMGKGQAASEAVPEG